MIIKLLPPLHNDGVLTQGFGENPEAYAKYGLPGHNGVDWGIPLLTPVYAAQKGKVIIVDYDKDGYGNYIKIDHGEYTTLYAHLTMAACRVGQDVEGCQYIGQTGSTGNSTGAHIHFELRIKSMVDNGYNGAVDPLLYLEKEIEVSDTQVAEVITFKPGDKAQVTAELGLRLRSGPSVDTLWLGLVPSGTIMDVIESQAVGDDVWIKTPVWMCAKRNGEYLLGKV